MTSATRFAERIRAARASATKLVVLRISEDVLTFIAVSADAIESFPDVMIDEIVDANAIAAALDAIEQSEPAPETRPIDARSALIFSTASGERILRAYKGSFPSRGQIDDDACAFEKPALHQWLAARYP